jgi:hypothetical protein
MSRGAFHQDSIRWTLITAETFAPLFGNVA